ncbi:MAG TPA: hypothetical protein DD856_14985 [Sulfobacillus sp.]|nr:hypothetical protein [Sulfobacillus sp.]
MTSNPDTLFFCQSCSVPLVRIEDFGTNRDGSPNEDYCSHWYRDGHFTEPDITVEDMVSRCVSIMHGMHRPDSEI